MKKLFVFVFTLLFTLAFTSMNFFNSANAEENNTTNYQELQKDGTLDKSVTQEQWNQFLQNSSQAKQQIENKSDVSTRSRFHLKAGDVLISNATSSWGLTGHAAIAISSKKILHIYGKGHHPATHSLSWFKKRYAKKGKWMKIYRSKKHGAGSKAARWARKHYVGKKYRYGINTHLSKRNPTYCSKIVYQAYRYGIGRKAMSSLTPIVSPYTLPNFSSNSYKLKRVKTY
ncbi:YiiX/YebB-like N1pC/P60 family cysteine hydrolase [Staphylococcus caprae]|uniref:YiiX/YebB-like N1pC/P60 family cysteine hydrolase n=1 Tax=Staphylococcus caprae TaxID=29380 RepID=UPI003906745B